MHIDTETDLDTDTETDLDTDCDSPKSVSKNQNSFLSTNCIFVRKIRHLINIYQSFNYSFGFKKKTTKTNI